MSAPCPTFGFVVTVHADADHGSAVVRELLRFLNDVELTGAVRGGSSPEVVVRREGSPVVHTDRERVRAWALEHAGRAAITVGDIVDLGDE